MTENTQEPKPQNLHIVEYEPCYQSIFKSLNAEWIGTYFKMEAADFKALDHPQEYILDRGGLILVALYENEPVGVCALIRMDDPEFDYELAKMAVSPRVQGKHIGLTLARAVIERAALLGASRLFLESNTILEPAISLYRKLGFVVLEGRDSPYERANIQMQLKL